FVFNDPARNKLANIGVGLWDTYNTATGLLGDVLSYLRLYALGLAGGMLGMAFNDMGRMVLGDGSSIVLWIPFLLLVLLGHTLNIAMCALGAFVHPLRLNFLEFFKNSGYEAAGRNYHPLKKQ
ncbi:MAG: V-type ATPase 116kDa subunit family protein, partial [Bacteroidales bacterium]|nr:V-type ATPase 116kDa subunit family protein [Bacteroidales bacterium]